MAATKNIIMGIIHAAIAIITYIILPWTGVTLMKDINIPGMGTIEYGRESFNIDSILNYIQALGILQAGFAFAKGSIPLIF